MFLLFFIFFYLKGKLNIVQKATTIYCRDRCQYWYMYFCSGSNIGFPIDNTSTNCVSAHSMITIVRIQTDTKRLFFFKCLLKVVQCFGDAFPT